MTAVQGADNWSVLLSDCFPGDVLRKGLHRNNGFLVMGSLMERKTLAAGCRLQVASKKEWREIEQWMREKEWPGHPAVELQCYGPRKHLDSSMRLVSWKA